MQTVSNKGGTLMDKPSVDGPVFMLSAKCLMLSPDSLREQMAAAMMYQTELLITEVLWMNACVSIKD
ncbi:hypothetical protein GN958_ATG20891 [Phytophthora infestans]|uniref:Uncharacterized protein n=1 Tax=Phytophthora infestans TaxID=4787 RepID=A0A8S9TVC3_PHYIN|nr:hypothetical protein GN958_ATG20891 [Phytophthora infestans]